jgi:hypothetical protein
VWTATSPPWTPFVKARSDQIEDCHPTFIDQLCSYWTSIFFRSLRLELICYHAHSGRPKPSRTVP